MNHLPKIPVVYLAGGMRSGWQKSVQDRLPGLIYLDPRNHGCQRLYEEEAGRLSLHKNETSPARLDALLERNYEKAYTAWDVQAVQSSDIVFAYLEKSNPGGQGLCVEVGIARTLGKHIIYVEEPGREDSRYYGMVRALATHVFSDLYIGISQLALDTGFHPWPNGPTGPALENNFRENRVTAAQLANMQYRLYPGNSHPVFQAHASKEIS